MSDDYYCLAQFFTEAEEEGVNFLFGAGVKVAGGFIGKKDGGALDDGPGNCDPLLLTSGKLRRLVGKTVSQAHQAKKFLRKEYEALKMELWKKFEHNRNAYTDAKTDFIRNCTSQARLLYGNRY